MATIHIHIGEGCEFIVSIVGNELDDPEVHQYMCENAPAGELSMPNGMVKRFCQTHLEQMTRWLHGDWRD